MNVRMDVHETDVLYRAVLRNHIDIASMISTRARVDVNVMNGMLFYTAVVMGHHDVLRMLLGFRTARPEKSRFDLLTLAMEYNRPKCMRILLNDGRLDPHTWNEKILVKACKRGLLDIVDVLLDDPRVQPCGSYHIPLRVACQSGNTRIVERLIRSDGSIKEHTIRDMIRTSIAYLRIDVIRVFMELTNINDELIRDSMKEIFLSIGNPIHYAEHKLTMREFVEKNIEILNVFVQRMDFAWGFDTCDVLESACGCPQMFDLTRRIMLHTRAKITDACMINAAACGNVQMVRELECRVDPDCNYNAPINSAARQGNVYLFFF
jgi:hypothetical protein